MNFTTFLLAVTAQQSFWDLFTQFNLSNLILGAIICLFLTSFCAPTLDNWIQTAILKWFWNFSAYSKHKLSGSWTHKWHVVSENFEPINVITSVEIRQFRNRIFAQYIVKDKSGKSYTYQMLGRIQNNSVITGTWRDISNGHRYFGCFQIQISVNENHMDGFWTGISNNNGIKSGRWEWIRG